MEIHGDGIPCGSCHSRNSGKKDNGQKKEDTQTVLKVY